VLVLGISAEGDQQVAHGVLGRSQIDRRLALDRY
jgi:hypothetical protein